MNQICVMGVEGKRTRLFCSPGRWACCCDNCCCCCCVGFCRAVTPFGPLHPLIAVPSSGPLTYDPEFACIPLIGGIVVVPVNEPPEPDTKFIGTPAVAAAAVDWWGYTRLF